jgi:hypothetical protein
MESKAVKVSGLLLICFADFFNLHCIADFCNYRITLLEYFWENLMTQIMRNDATIFVVGGVIQKSKRVAIIGLELDTLK